MKRVWFQGVKWVVQVVKLAYQFTGKDLFKACLEIDAVAQINKCFLDHAARYRILSVTVSSLWYNLAEYFSFLLPGDQP